MIDENGHNLLHTGYIQSVKRSWLSIPSANRPKHKKEKRKKGHLSHAAVFNMDITQNLLRWAFGSWLWSGTSPERPLPSWQRVQPRSRTAARLAARNLDQAFAASEEQLGALVFNFAPGSETQQGRINRFWWDQILDQQGGVLIIPMAEARRGWGVVKVV